MIRINRTFKLLALGLLVLVGGGWWLWFRDRQPQMRYQLEPVRQTNLEVNVVANGTLNPVTTVLVGTQVTGMIKEIYADYNSEVKKGQVIAQIDQALFKARVAQAQGNYRLAQANVLKAQANLQDALNDYRRYQKLWEQNLVARDELDNAYTRYETSRAELHAAQAQVAQAAANLKSAETDLHYTTIVSPVDGVVVSRDVDVGQTVVASFQTPTLFNIAQDLTQMQVDTAVDEADIGKVKEGQIATFTVDAYPGQTFTGQVTQVRLSPQTLQNVVTYNVVIETKNPELLLKPGMTASVAIQVARREKVTAVANAALRFRPRAPAAPPLPEGNHVWRLGPDNQPVPVPLVTGLSDGQWTEVVEGDLKVGDQVIVAQISKEDAANPERRSPTRQRRPF
ncbi:MAG: efflux RND transporter periplasmic adaptor subunit [Deltaproteobacteria bacterium]|nr:efflux RND transporter periplasmic adaptor subunit [Deltaproteobacteria bacterium]MBW1987227.1 efflux RND transporter periplasmic adaptor subunit [Deltaproteobacteria bacterium]